MGHRVGHDGDRERGLFQACSVQYGDKMTRGKSIVCGKCGVIGRVPFNTVFSVGNDERQEDRLIARKFSNMGWQVGIIPSRHRCPVCLLKTKPLAEKLGALKVDRADLQSHATAYIRENNMPSLPPKPPKPAPVLVVDETPRVMEREDRRLIFAKLNEVYDKAYSDDWTDKRVAEDLGVPRAWVAQVRDENFGPERNEEIALQVEQAKQVLAQGREMLARLDKVKADIASIDLTMPSLRAMMDKAEKTLASIEKALVA